MSWWNQNTGCFISKLLLRYCIESRKNDVEITDEEMMLICDRSHELNAEVVITAGLTFMGAKTFHHYSYEMCKVPFADALSYRYAITATVLFPKIIVRYHGSSFGNGDCQVILSLDGVEDTAIIFVCGAPFILPKELRSTFVNQDFDRHFDANSCHGDKFMTINLSMDGDFVVLPQNSKYNENVYNYIHKTNTLLLGDVTVEQRWSEVVVPH